MMRILVLCCLTFAVQAATITYTADQGVIANPERAEHVAKMARLLRHGLARLRLITIRGRKLRQGELVGTGATPQKAGPTGRQWPKVRADPRPMWVVLPRYSLTLVLSLRGIACLPSNHTIRSGVD